MLVDKTNLLMAIKSSLLVLEVIKYSEKAEDAVLDHSKVYLKEKEIVEENSTRTNILML